jgi:hypothetical protein
VCVVVVVVVVECEGDQTEMRWLLVGVGLLLLGWAVRSSAAAAASPPVLLVEGGRFVVDLSGGDADVADVRVKLPDGHTISLA